MIKIVKGGPHKCSDFKKMKLTNKYFKEKRSIRTMSSDENTNKVSDVTGNLIYDGEVNKVHSKRRTKL